MQCLNKTKHQASQTCKKLTSRRQHEIRQNAQAQANDVVFTVNGKAVEEVHEFKYLGRIISDDDDDTKCIFENLKKAKNRWNCIAKILKREGANAVCMSRFYLTIVQAVLLYGADSWTITKPNMKKLESFHKRATRYMTGKHIRKINDLWEYPNHEELLKICKLFPVDIYIQRRRGTLKNYFDKYREELLAEAESTSRHYHSSSKVLWWNQPWIQKTELNNLARLWFPQ